ncbi:cyclin G-associated kinase [Microdochium nivale]|nr:cyclin G-associated kinase [Microdochium nivale]
MDDLSGLDWSKPATQTNTANYSSTGSRPLQPPASYSSLRPTPSPQLSGRGTPLSTQSSGLQAAKVTNSKPAGDSFSNLVSFSGTKGNANLSLRERQQQLEDEKRRKAEQQQSSLQSQYGGGQFWDSLGQGSSQASRTASPAAFAAKPSTISANSDEDDIFAAFNKNTKVDNSSHYPPPPSTGVSGKNTPSNAGRLDLTSANAWRPPQPGNGDKSFSDDNDPFGLGQMKPASARQQEPAATAASEDDDDDLLGDLGKPVDQIRKQAQSQAQALQSQTPKPIEDSSSDDDEPPSHRQQRPGGEGSDPFDKAVAELVDMGFTPENARRGLTESGSGLNVQAAVGWLLDDAHRQARKDKSNPRDSPADRVRREESSQPRRNGSPAWMRDDQDGGRDSRQDVSSHNTGEDLSKKAAQVGSSFLKTANSLWKTGSKQVQKAYAEFQQEGGDPSQPKWMRNASQAGELPTREAPPAGTDEAMMLESGARPEPRRSARPSNSRDRGSQERNSSLSNRPSPAQSAPRWQQTATPPPDSRSRLNKLAAEEQSAQAYISPARRKKTPVPSQPASAPAPAPEHDLLFGTSEPARPQAAPQSVSRQAQVSTKPTQPAQSRPIVARPLPTARQIPSVQSGVLEASSRHRAEGTAHFKRGDYDAAHTSYTNSLSGVPQTHPLCIVLLTNRALTALKTGSPKQAVSDADAALGIIGSSRGEGEKVIVGPGEERDMKDLYGKALSRKAEALEQMEKWADASGIWHLAVEGGVGGSNAIAGRQRCQNALTPKPKAPARPPQATRPRPKPSVMSDLTPQKSSEAVQRLREANKAAEAADEEKFALSEKIDARVSAWRDGKRDNLRSLIGSLDQVLWEGSGWKKVGMHELVLANKVKISYMKAIAKCHPDKLPQGASTEVQLIAAIVFATLNESWDKFKAENNL